MNHVKLSIVIPCLNKNDPKLRALLTSIDTQDFPKEEMETLVITEGTSESAKAIGIRKAKGEVIGILASDNYLTDYNFLSNMVSKARNGRASAAYYYYDKEDDILNRYFALFGCNDPLAFYMKKNDKFAYFNYCAVGDIDNQTLGDNGFFVDKKLIEKTDLDNYYHIDNALEVDSPLFKSGTIWHKTGGNIFKFFAKRYHYGLQHAFNKNRRWHLVDFSKPGDIWRLTCFILFAITLIQPLLLSLKGYMKIQDVAWFLHPIVCLLTLATYTILLIRLGLKKLSQSLFVPMNVQIA